MADQQPNHQQLWLQNMVQADQALQNALHVFYLACDKEVATAAAYKALGMDPRDIPRFGWGQMTARPPGVSVEQTVEAPRSVGMAAGNGPLGKLLGIGALAVALAVGGTLLATKPAALPLPQTAPTAPAKQEIEIRWRIVDGRFDAQIVPVNPDEKK